MIEQLLEKYSGRVNLVLKHYPLSQHKAARAAARAALAASRQGKYIELSDLMYKNYKTLNDDRIKEYAQQVGLDMVKFEGDLNSAAVREIIQQDIGLARKIRIRGVPSLYINGRAVKNYSLDGMSQMIEKELEKSQQ